MNKKTLSERDICTKFITPNLVAAGWDLDTQIREEVGFTDGRIYVRGKIHARGAKKRVDHIPLPPLAEQAAIVARVEALMEHCRALAAENRVFKDKPGGLIVDYVGHADQLKRTRYLHRERRSAPPRRWWLSPTW